MHAVKRAGMDTDILRTLMFAFSMIVVANEYLENLVPSLLVLVSITPVSCVTAALCQCTYFLLALH